METALLLTLNIAGLLALYWVVWGQWKHNKKLQEAEELNEKKILEENK